MAHDEDNAAGADIVVTGQRAAANPLAERSAPWKVDKLASSKVTEPHAVRLKI